MSGLAGDDLDPASLLGPEPEPVTGAGGPTASAPWRAMGRFPRIAALSLGAALSSAVVTLLVARWLGPGSYGEAQAVLLAYALAGLFQTGVYTGAVRLAIHQRGLGDATEAGRAQNVGASFELVASVLPGLALAAAAPFVHSDVVRVGFLLAPLAVTASSAAGFLGGIEIGYDRAERETVAAVAGSLTAAALALGGVLLIGAYAVILAPTVGCGVMIAVLWPRLHRAGLHPDFDWRAARPLVRAGLPFAGLAVAYWLYRWIGPTAVALGLGTTAVGLYSIANAPVTLAIGTMGLAQRVVMPSFWQRMARPDDRGWVADGDRVTASLMVLSGLATTAGQALYPWFVQAVLPEYRGSIPVFEVLALQIPLFVVTLVPNLVLQSLVVDRQRVLLAVWVGALAANVALVTVVLAAGAGAVGVAWVAVGCQVLVAVVTFTMARRFEGPFLGRRAELGGAAVAGLATLAVGTCMVALTTGGSGAAHTALRLGVLAGGWLVAGVAAVLVAAAAPLDGRVVRPAGPEPATGGPGGLHVHFYSDNDAFSGSETMMYNVAAAVVAAGGRATVTYRAWPDYEAGARARLDRDDLRGRVTVWPLAPPLLPRVVRGTGIPGLPRASRLVRGLLAVTGRPVLTWVEGRRLGRLWVASGASMVHVNNGGFPGAPSCTTAAAAAHRRGVPVVYAVHNLAIGYQGLVRRLDRPYDRAARAADRFVTGSGAAARALAEVLELDPGRVATIPNAATVGSADLDPDEVRRRVGLEPGDRRPVALVMARLEERKGHRVLLEAVPALDGAAGGLLVLCAGDGPLREVLAAEIARAGLGDRVRLLGEWSNPWDLYQVADVVVLPSTGYEDFPVVVVEAMAAGRVVVAARVGGVAEQVVDDVTGFTFPPGDADALAACLQQTLGDAGRRAAMEHAARARFHAEFAPDRLIGRYLDLYRRVAAPPP